MLEESLVVRFFTQISNWFSYQFKKSTLISGFLSESARQESGEGSVFYRMFLVIRALCRKFIIITHLNVVFRGSIFKMAYLWSILAVVISPFMPTMIVFGAVLASFLSLFLALIYDKKKKLRYFAINKYIYFFGLAYLFATLTSVTLKDSLFGGVLSVCFMLFSVVLINSIETKKQMHGLLFLFICVGIIVSFYGFYQFLFPDKFSGVWHDKQMFEDISFRIYSTLGNPNVLGEYLLLVIPTAVAFFFISKSISRKLFYLAASGVMMLALILTYSRGCYVGILVALFIFLVLMDKRFIFLGLIGLVALPFILPPTIINRFMSIGNMADSSTSYRVYIWMGTLAMLKDYWLCGIGPGTSAFNLVYPAYAYNGISAPHSHNLFLQIISDSGVIGFVLFMAVIYQFYKTTFGAITRERNRNTRILIISAISSVTGFLVQSLFDYTFYNYRVMLLFWIMLALGILFTKINELRGENTHD